MALPSPRAAVRTLLTGYADGGAPWVRAMAEPGDDGWFGPGSTIWAVHADAATLVGGVRALLVQAMHPTVLAGFDQHSDYREDPESRLQRTAAFVTVTTFGTSAQAADACARVRRAHAPVRGRTPDGGDLRRRRSRAARAGCTSPSPTRSRWRYVATGGPRSTWTPTSPTWRSSGSGSAPPTSRSDRAGLAAAWAHYRPQLAVTEQTAAAHAFLLDPPLPPRIRWPYRVIAAAAVATLPPDLRPLLSGRPLLPDLPARVVGRAATRLLAGVLGESPAAAAAHRRTPAPASRP